MNLSEIEPATFRLVAQCFNQLRFLEPPTLTAVLAERQLRPLLSYFFLSVCV
jgi:hypothetical protein